jgi:hypothetical protein
MLHFFGEWSNDERESTNMSSLSLNNYVSAYSTKWNAYIIEFVSTIGNQICFSDLTIQHLTSYYGHRGGTRNLGKEKTANHRAKISMALSGKVGKKKTAGKPVQVDNWMNNLASAKTFIDTEGRMPKSKAGDAEERRRGQWIAYYKHKEGGTNSEREQLMRREIPLTFKDNSDKWIDNLANCKTFIDIEGRMLNQRADDVDERRLGKWIVNNKASYGGTNSEREQLMGREIPLAFANR